MGRGAGWPGAAPYYGVFVVLGLSVGFVGPSLDALGERAGVSDAAIGLVFVVQGAAYLVGALGVGRLFDRRSGHALLALALAALVIGFASLGLATPLSAVLLAFVVIGIATSAIDVGGNTLLVWVAPADRLVGLLNGLHLCFGLGALASPLVVGLSIGLTDSIVPACLTVAAVAAISAVAVRSVPSPRPRPRAEIHAARPPLAPIVAICVFFALYVGLEAGFVGWLYTFAVDSGTTSDGGAALVVALFWAGFCTARLVAATIGQRVRPDATLLVTTSATLVPSLALVVAGTNPTVLAVASAALGAALGPQFSLMIAFAERHLTLTGGITSLFIAAAAVGGMSIPWLIGLAMDRRDADAFTSATLVGSVLVLMALGAVRVTTALTRAAAPAAGRDR